VLGVPFCTSTGNPSFFLCCGSKNDDASEAVENGGGVGESGMPFRERETTGREDRRKERHSRASFAMLEENAG